MKEQIANHFEPDKWKGHAAFMHYKHTGKNLIQEINALDPDLVIDAGCGHNRFKGHINNLIGFDSEPFPYVDIVDSIENINFREGCADAILALGSLQFGDREFVKKQTAKVASWLKPGGFLVMRTMNDWLKDTEYPFWDHQYKWTKEDVEEIGLELNLELHKGIFTEWVPEKTKDGPKWKSTRLAWWWQKPGIRQKFSIDPISCEINERM